MVDQLLWIHALIDLISGALLLTFPTPLLILLGLPRAKPAFYVRCLGALLVGVGLSLVVEGSDGKGLNLGGAAVINVTGGLALLGLLTFARPEMTLRGRFVLWGVTILLLLLSAVQLAYAG